MIRVAADQFAKDSATYLARAERGDEVLIERDGRVVARLSSSVSAIAEEPEVPLHREAQPDHSGESDVSRELRRLREGVTLGGLDWKALRDEGRR